MKPHCMPNFGDAKADIASFTASNTLKTSPCCKKQHLSTTEVENIVTNVRDW